MEVGRLQSPGDRRGHQYPSISLADSAQAHLGDQIYNEYHNHNYSAPPRPVESPPLPCFTVPFCRDPDFVGHVATLDTIERKLSVGGARVVLVGVGGVGKSQIAIEYCHRLHERSPATWIFWIHASNVDRIAQGFREIAEEARILGRDEPGANVFELVQKWLRTERKEKWLLVIDNVDDEAVLTIPAQGEPQSETQSRAGLSTLIPPSSNGSTLITSRSTNVAAKLVESHDTIPIAPMTNASAVQLLANKLNGESSDPELTELAMLLESMPLAIVQAAAYIQQRKPRYSVKHYIDDFENSDQRRAMLLTHEAGHLRRADDAKNSIMTTLQISFKHIRARNPSSIDLLCLMSFFDRQSIPEFILHQSRKWRDYRNWFRQVSDGDIHASDADEFEQCVQTLRSYMLISVKADGHTFSMHRLVQLAVSNWLISRRRDQEIKTVFLRRLYLAFPDEDYGNWRQCEILFPHVMSAEKLRPDQELGSRCLLNWARTLHRAGQYMLERGNTCEAERLCRRSLDMLEVIGGNHEVDQLAALSSLSKVHFVQRRPGMAKGLLVRAAEITKKAFDPDDAGLALMLKLMMAVLYISQGQLEDAEKLLVKLRKASRRIYGAEDGLTLTFMEVLAALYLAQNRLAKAAQAMARAAKAYAQVLGPDHSSTLRSMDSLATIYQQQGQLEEAEALAVRVLKAREVVLEQDHPDTIKSMETLSRILKKQRRDDEAITLMVTCMKLADKNLGPMHPITQVASDRLAAWQNSTPVRTLDQDNDKSEKTAGSSTDGTPMIRKRKHRRRRHREKTVWTDVVTSRPGFRGWLRSHLSSND